MKLSLRPVSCRGIFFASFGLVQDLIGSIKTINIRFSDLYKNHIKMLYFFLKRKLSSSSSLARKFSLYKPILINFSSLNIIPHPIGFFSQFSILIFFSLLSVRTQSHATASKFSLMNKNVDIIKQSQFPKLDFKGERINEEEMLNH